MTERLNIRRMQMPEREEIEGPFDPRRDILPSDWSNMEAQAEELRNSDLTDFLRMYSQMRHMKKGSVSTLTAEDRKRSVRLLDTYKRQVDWHHFLWVASALRISEPSRALPPMGEIESRGVYNQIQEDMHETHCDWGRMALHSMQAALIMPDKEWKIIPSGPLDESLTWAREGPKTRDETTSYAFYVGALRAIRPDIKIEVSTQTWNLMHSELIHLRQEGWWAFFTSHTFFMMLIAAEEVKLSKEKGLEITMHIHKTAAEPTRVPEPLNL